ncbi:IS1634 family transposase [Tindallia californiensis]|uniref:Transposase DDE domain-containing protein n=1 Tax=Tindallia californiensis TaxID=159292 RepID=A0A1H3QLF6_9FIRM|nr:IS1634 family transposase [Tindallia californiensis]SDZ13569.1 Transposase DDE domain-containing protein [Tindallia californiensis]
MYLKKSRQKSGRVYLSIVDGYYDKERGHPRTVTIEKVGYLDELEKVYEDPIAVFEERVAQLKKEKAEKKRPVVVEFSPEEVLEKGQGQRKNVGYLVLSQLYHELGIDQFLINRQKTTKLGFNTNDVMKLLVFSRLLRPGSKRRAFEDRHWFFEKTNYSLDDVYRSLSFFHQHRKALQLWIHERIQQYYGRDTRLVYYDVTNYYFESDPSEELRQKGFLKERRPNPIVQMGLFMDSMGIPITYELFPGNWNDSLTYRPCLSRVHREFGLGKVVVVADKGIITGDNIMYTLSGKHGYVFSFSIRRADEAFQKYVLDQSGYEWYGDKYKRKSRLSPRKIWITNTQGKKVQTTVHERQVVFYSEKYAKKAKREREKAVAKAMDLIQHPGRYSRATSKGAAGYVKHLQFDKKTGEVLERDHQLELNMEKVAAEEMLDGYYALVTSEYQESPDQIIDMYRGLWRIEESFRVTKSDLEARPVYVSREDHIEAHFLTCFVALVMARLLERKLDRQYSIRRLLESLAKTECTPLKQNYFLFDFYDEVMENVGTTFNLDFSKRIHTLGDIKKMLASTKKR